MNNDSPLKALIVVLAVAFFCSVLVSVAAIGLKPVQQRNQLVDRGRNIVSLTGLVAPGETLSDDEVLEAVQQLDIRIVNVDTGEFDSTIDPLGFDERAAANDDELSVPISPDDDLARLGRRSRFAVVYLVWDDEQLSRIILPIHGQGMWSTLYGYIAVNADFNTIAAVRFYEQKETAGLGDQIERPDWQEQWQGRQMFGAQGDFRFRVAAGTVEPGSPAARHQVDALTGATITANAVTRLVEYWFGPAGSGVFLDKLAAQRPVRLADNRDESK